MNNPFDVIDARLSTIENLILDLKHQPNKIQPTGLADQWFDLNDLVDYDPEKRTKPTWYSLVSNGKVPYYKRGKKLVFLKSEIDEFLKSGRRKSAHESSNAPEEFMKQPKIRRG